MKTSILVRDDLPTGVAIVTAAHASLAAYLEFRDHPDVATWLAGPFRKVVCRVDEGEFERAKTVDDHVVLTESSLDDREVAIAFRPREQWPKAFRFLRLYR